MQSVHFTIPFMKILVLEDDFTLSKEIRQFLVSKEFECDAVYDGSLVIKQIQVSDYDLFILDINVPGKNGFEVCKQIRLVDKETPILMLTAFGEVSDKVTAFNNGADDYLVKPFHFDELFVRISALLRRKSMPQQAEEKIIVADLVINLTESKVHRNGNEILLSPKEYQLLVLLAKARGKSISKQVIAETIWDYNIETNYNTIEVYINFLRKKIDKDFEQKLIQTRPGFGYFLKAE